MGKTKWLITAILVLSLMAFVTTFNYGGCGGGGGGSSGSSTPPPVTIYPPDSPSSLVANTISSSQIYLSWTDNSNNEYNFEVWRKTGPTGTYSRIATPSSSYYNDTGLSASTAYYYLVRAVGTGGNSSYSNEDWATTSSGGGGGDAWDPTDDTASNGTWLSPTTSNQSHGSHTLSASDQYDWFRISMTSGRTYYFDTIGGSGDNLGQLYSDSSGSNLVASGDDEGGGLQFAFSYTAANTQTYYLKIRAYTLGNAWSGNLNYSYSAGGDTTAPTVLSVSPVNNSTGVSVSDNILVTFSEAMNQTATQESFTMSLIPGGLNFSWSGNTLTVNPTNDFTNNTTYTCRITTTARDSAGNYIASQYEWSFTTVSTGGGTAVDDYVWVANYTSNTVTRIKKSDLTTTTIAVGTQPLGVAVDTTYVWVTNYSSNNVTRIKKSDLTTTTISVGTGPQGVAVDTTYVWVANGGSNNVTRIKKSDSTTTTITVDTNPKGVAVDGTYVWVANYNSGTVTVITKSDLSTGRFTLGGNPYGVAVDTTYVWVTNWTSNNVTRITKSTFNTTTIAVGSSPKGVAVDGTYVWVANGGSNNVTRIKKSDSTTTTIAVGLGPYGVAVDDTYCWVANNSDFNVTRILKSDSTKTTISVGSYPNSVGDMTGYAYDNYSNQ